MAAPRFRSPDWLWLWPTPGPRSVCGLPTSRRLVTPLLPARSSVQRIIGTESEALDRFGEPDILHDNGIWLPHNHRLAMLAEKRGIPRVVSTRGMLEPWALSHKRLKKRHCLVAIPTARFETSALPSSQPRRRKPETCNISGSEFLSSPFRMVSMCQRSNLGSSVRSLRKRFGVEEREQRFSSVEFTRSRACQC